MKVEPFGRLDPALYREIVRRALAEDLRWGDVTTEAIVAEDARAVGTVVAGQSCVVAGLDVAIEVFAQLDPGMSISHRREDGERCEPGDDVLRVTGSARALLTAERTALNFLQRMSGIATLTRQFVDVAAGRTVVLDTRKTTPTLRVLEKYAVRAGGGVNHRLALDDGILIKDNHIALAGSIAVAVERVKRAGHELPVEVEAQSLEDVAEALSCGVDTVLVDNLPLEDVAAAIEMVGGRVKIEVSGGVSLERVDALAATGPDFVSVGALTHSAPAIDLSFDVEAAAGPSSSHPA